MATEIKVWQVSQKDGLVPIYDTLLEASHLESELESWIEKDPEILGDDLLVIDRQLPIPGIGRMDLLCIDSTGALVIVELKRASTPREAVAQALDYASWLDGASEAQIQMILDRAQEHLGKPLGEAFTEHFQQTEMPQVVGQKHRIILAAPRLDAAAERIINFLANRYSVQINAVFFKYARLSSGEEILARSVLVPEEIVEGKKNNIRPGVKLPDLLKIADERKVSSLLEACRQMSKDWEEHPSHVYGGSFTYWAEAGENASRAGLSINRRMVYGINVSAQEMGAPAGELDVWIPVRKLAEATQVDEATIRSTLEKQNPPAWTKSQNTGEKFWIRVSAPAQAEALVKQLREWASTKKPSSATF